MTTLATYIRDQAYQRLTTGTVNQNWKTTRKVPVPTMQPNELPCLAVYLQRENLASDGDPNVTFNYVSDLVLGISVFVDAQKAEALDGLIDPMVDIIEDTLLEDYTFTSLKLADGVTQLIESFPNISRTYNYPQNGEFYFMEVRLQLTIRFRCTFQPIAPNDLLEVDVTNVPFANTSEPGNYTTSIPLTPA